MKQLFFPLFLTLLIACAANSELSPGCPLDNYELRGSSLSGLLEAGTIITATNTSCKNITRNSLVLYNHSGRETPLIKIVKGLPGDELTTTNNNIIVNNKTLTTSTGEAYHITGNKEKMISLYEGTIQNDSYLLLGNQPGGSLDSTRYGLIPKDQILGVVIE